MSGERPGLRGAFEGWRPSVDDCHERRAQLARRMGAAIDAQDLDAVQSCARAWPGAIFYQDEASRKDRDALVEDRLRSAPGAFAYDAGRAWALGAKDQAAGWEGELREGIEKGVNSVRYCRMGLLAFACGAAESGAMGAGFPSWLAQAGGEGPPDDFGMAEWRVWGRAWVRASTERGPKRRSAMAGRCLRAAMKAALEDGLAEGVAMAREVEAALGASERGWLGAFLGELGREEDARAVRAAERRPGVSLMDRRAVARQIAAAERLSNEARMAEFFKELPAALGSALDGSEEPRVKAWIDKIELELSAGQGGAPGAPRRRI